MSLNHVFAVSFLSCKGDGGWVHRLNVLQSNECKSSPFQIAGNIAAHHMRVDETGVQVEYLGLQKDLTKGGKKPQPSEEPITPMGCFVLTIERK
jgi:hypothetical protein